MGLVVIGIIILAAGFAMRASAKQQPQVKPIASLMIVGGPLIAVFGFISASVVIVESGYTGIKLRLGAAVDQVPEGMHFLAPGIEKIALMEVRTQKEESMATAASRDLQPVTASLALNFRLDPSKASDLYKEVGTDFKNRIIAPSVQEAIKVVTAQYTAEDLIRQRQKVKNEVEQQIAARLAKYYLIVDPGGLSITNFEFSEEFNKAIEQKTIAQQEAEKQRFVLARAELEKQTKVAQAQGEAEAAKLNAQALQANGGELVIAREWIEKWDGKMPTVAGGNSGYMLDLRQILNDSQKANP